MILEIHTHTLEHSPCSQIRAADLIKSIYDRGIDGVVLTDHHYLWSDRELRSLWTRLKLSADFLVMSGQEVFTKDFGDVLVYGARDSIAQGISLMELRRTCPEAALVWAHPYRSGQIPDATELFDANLDAIEILNPHQKEWENERGISDWNSWGFTATSGSDIHSESYSEFYPLKLEHEIMDMHGLVACIKEGLCTPTLKGE